MSEKKVNTVTDNTEDITASIVSALSEGDSESLINLVRTHGLSYCGASYGGYALLRDAVTSGHYDIAKFLLQEGMKVDCKTDNIDSLLHYATEKGWAEFVGLLLEKNARIDARNGQNETPLHLAVKKRFSNIVQVLLDNKASLTARTDKGATPLLLALESRCGEIVGMLLKHANAKDEVNKNSAILDRILLCSPSARDQVNRLVVLIATGNDERSKIIDDLIDCGFILSREHVNESLLVAAIKKNHIKLIENIQLSNVDLNDAKYNPLLLGTAVKYGRIEIVKLLLKSGLDVNAEKFGATPICYAVQSNEEGKCVEILQLLLASGADIKKTGGLLHRAVKKGLFEVCKVLVESGVPIDALDGNGNTPLHLAVPRKEGSNADKKEQKSKKEIDDTTASKIIKLFLSSGVDVSIRARDGLTAFHRAVENGRKEAVRTFLDFGIDANLPADDDVTPLHLAALAGHKDILELLLASSANVSASLESNGATPLHLASKYGHNQIVAILCETGANMNVRQLNGWTPLHFAATEHHVDVLNMLLDRGVDVNARGSTNETALHCALGNPDSYDAAKILLENGCDINAETDAGETALDIAVAEARLFFSLRRLGTKLKTNYELRRFDTAFNVCRTSAEDYDYVPDQYPTVEVLKRHLMKLKVAGLFVSRRNLYLLDKTTDKDGDGYFEIPDIERKTEDELNRMKKTQLTPEFTLSDVLLLVTNNNPAYAKNQSLVQTLQSFNWEEFRVYGNLIRHHFKRNMLRVELVSSGLKSLDILVKTSTRLNGKISLVLPEELLERIVLYLNNYELKCLICCGEALKRQLC